MTLDVGWVVPTIIGIWVILIWAVTVKLVLLFISVVKRKPPTP